MESATLFKDLLAFEYLLGNQPDRKPALLHVPRDPLAVRATAKVARHGMYLEEPPSVEGVSLTRLFQSPSIRSHISISAWNLAGIKWSMPFCRYLALERISAFARM
jgi:hypothetical protein